MRDDVHQDEQSERVRAGAPDENARGDEAERERLSAGAEAVSQGRDVHDLTRHGAPRGRDVLSDEDTSEIESHGRTVIDRSHRAEAHGVDVIDLGPRTPSPEEESDA